MKSDSEDFQFDFIGDIHGHAYMLVKLLNLLGYTYQNGSYAHPTRKAFFVGDYIDRGPQIKETLEIVKSMVDNGNAIALMGNHEYNALCFHYPDKKGGHLRKHSITNVIQHYQTLKQFQNRQTEYESYLEWFKTLPIFFETDQFGSVHSCWDNDHIAYLRTRLKDNCLSDDLLYESAQKGTELNLAIEETLKGKEMKLPTGKYFKDKDGTERTEFRIKWWEDPTLSTYQTLAIEPGDYLPETMIDLKTLTCTNFYSGTDKPIFFGHYWLKGKPNLHRNNICCLDYSVAKEGHLAAYRFDGEKELSNGNIVFV